MKATKSPAAACGRSGGLSVPSASEFWPGASGNSFKSNYTGTLQGLQEEVEGKFEPKKKDSLILSEVYRQLGLVSRSLRVYECGSYLEYSVSVDDKRLSAANFCRDRLCPMCNWRRSLKIFGQVSRVMDVLEKRNYRFLFLTLTVRNCSAADLPDTVTALLMGWRALYRSSVFSAAVLGSFRSLEVTRNSETGTYHPHLHCILAVTSGYFCGPSYLSQAAWTDLWRECCSLDYTPIVHIQTVKAVPSGLAGAVAEVAKYSVKATDFLRGSPAQMVDTVAAFLRGLSGRRLCGFTGCFADVRRQLHLDDIEDGDLVHLEDSIRPDVACVIVRYQWRCGAYIRLEE